MDRKTLEAVYGWLDTLERDAALSVERRYDPDATTPQQTAHAAGKAAGIRDARAWIERCAKKAPAPE